jgi:quercetin dioxygenase-like cupin family protein
MIRCVRLWSGADGQSHFAEGAIALAPGVRGDALSKTFPVGNVSFQETDADPKLGWHTDAARQLVITLSGELTFETRDGSFQLKPGDILFTEDTCGRGHDWKLTGDTPWRRLYALLDPETMVPFTPTERSVRGQKKE